MVEVSDVWIDQARFVEMLNQTLNSVTPEEARKAAGNNRGYLHSMSDADAEVAVDRQPLGYLARGCHR